MSLEILSSLWSHANENENKIVRNQNREILKSKHMIWSYSGYVPFPQLTHLTLSGKISSTGGHDGRSYHSAVQYHKDQSIASISTELPSLESSGFLPSLPCWRLT